ncbi:MAG: LacI family DNA-binding transcriptional regulator [Vicinamibacterales bacterium]
MAPTTTMKRIAGELGVSITTVSKVMNNRDDIGHATRARVTKTPQKNGRSLTMNPVAGRSVRAAPSFHPG